MHSAIGKGNPLGVNPIPFSWQSLARAILLAPCGDERPFSHDVIEVGLIPTRAAKVFESMPVMARITLIRTASDMVIYLSKKAIGLFFQR